MPPLVPNTIGYLLDLDGPRGDIIKRVTNLQLHRGIGDSLWAKDQGDRPPSVRIYRSQLLFWGTFCSYTSEDASSPTCFSFSGPVVSAI